MTTVTVSPKYQIVIPKSMRDAMGIKAGEKAQIIPYENRLEFIPLKPIRKMKGFLRGIDTAIRRENDRV